MSQADEWQIQDLIEDKRRLREALAQLLEVVEAGHESVIDYYRPKAIADAKSALTATE